MDPSQDFKSLQDAVQASLISTTRTVNRIASEDLTFQRTANPRTGDRLEELSTRLLSVSSELVNAAAKANGQRSVESLEDTEDVDIHWAGIVDVIDGLLEKADTALDEYTGRVKRKIDIPEPPPSKKLKTNDRFEPNWRRANIIKPQNAFEKKVDNFASGPWKPLLTKKPHATVSLEESLSMTDDGKNKNQYKHPYEAEILNLKYPPRTYEKHDPIPYQPIEKAPAVWVDTYEGVLEMLEELKQADEIAVDLEHHDTRSYHGLLSLMQISTREKDWVIDTLRPWRHKLEVLNEVFADPKILKVFHGAFMDIIWLQRDLGLYIVGLFDTYHASVALNYPQKSLAFLLKKFVDFDADKKYQMADWRIRPLTDEMMYYARCDTHYLLYVYDNMRNDLVTRSDPNKPQESLIEYALQRSKETSLDRYSSYVADPDSGDGTRGWINALMRSSIRLDGPQFAVYRAVHKWRDDLARTEDEGPFFIMPQQTLMEIARLLPVDPKALHSILGSRCASIVQRSLSELFEVISKAKKEGETGPSSVEFLRGTLADNSLAAVATRELQQSKKPKPDLPPVEVLRAEKSQLFGDMPISSLWESPSQVAKKETSTLISLPWTTYIQEAMVSSAQLEAEAKAKKQEPDIIPLESTPKAPAPPPEVDNTEFTLRQGRKRKMDDVQAEESDADAGGGAALSQDVIPLHDEETKAQRKERKRAERKAKRTAKAEQKGQKPQRTSKTKRMPAEDDEDEDDEEGEDEAPFDYSNAQSVLHAQRAMMGAPQEGKGKKKAFDPYAARINADGPKPARRMHGEKAGRTFTFKK
ncbi:exosome nuclease subunit [Gnomoniopsis smithogilvyi]|uniref:Exosome nuclease subunit n=1 Tax=Gnomoniopsis smithogilvyi TaxID=1191159 RepID=A0A9W8YPT7_9PEZI|nr:exosome nuclease subunit [Gnomoniopsis smithogilvyi]